LLRASPAKKTSPATSNFNFKREQDLPTEQVQLLQASAPKKQLFLAKSKTSCCKQVQPKESKTCLQSKSSFCKPVQLKEQDQMLQASPAKIQYKTVK
jgi:hypothetical protein